MKRLTFTALLLLAFSTVSMHAQSFVEQMHFEASTATGMRNNGITPIDFSFKYHVDLISALYIFIAVEDNLSLFKNNEIKTYVNGTSLGGGLGAKLLNRTKSSHALDLRVKALETLGKPDWKRTTYDASLAWYIKSAKFSPVVELGYRFLDSHTQGFDNYGNVYISFGLRY